MGEGHEASLAYHAKLLGDPHRVVAYDRALRALVRPGDVVLDVGAGTGLLSVLAARCGAGRVHAVESMPVARLIGALAEANGLADRVIVHHTDFRQLAPVEPVDLVVSDFMGRFLVDDDMLDVIAAAGAWLKPDGRCCPSELRLLVAPAGIGEFGPLDVWSAPCVGLDVSPVLPSALNYAYGAQLPPSAILAEPLEYHRLAPPSLSEPFDHELTFRMSASGRLRGLAGWFEATLAPSVLLTTEPGVETHWHQYLLPLPATQVLPGDELSLRLRLDDDQTWRWEGEIRCPGRPPIAFQLASKQPADATIETPPTPPRSTESLVELNHRGARALAEGNVGLAMEAFEQAVRRLGPEDEAMAPSAYENLGLAYLNAGRYAAAIPAFLRALDGQPASREQSARFLVDACFRIGRNEDGQRFLRSYVEAFGPHPSGSGGASH